MTRNKVVINLSEPGHNSMMMTNNFAFGNMTAVRLPSAKIATKSTPFSSREQS